MERSIKHDVREVSYLNVTLHALGRTKGKCRQIQRRLNEDFVSSKRFTVQSPIAIVLL